MVFSAIAMISLFLGVQKKRLCKSNIGNESDQVISNIILIFISCNMVWYVAFAKYTSEKTFMWIYNICINACIRGYSLFKMN